MQNGKDGKMSLELLRDSRILITGHTGFKGSWLTLWLQKLGAKVTGVSLDPKTPMDAFYAMKIGESTNDLRHDINDLARLKEIFDQSVPEVVFHLAAQPLVLEAIDDPMYTLQTNIMGTANVLEASRSVRSVRAIIVVTSDKCYENHETGKPFREVDSLGGNDPYSASKACSEVITSAFRRTYFQRPGEAAIATVRAGNIIGGGDWSANRIVPDCIRALQTNSMLSLRSPEAVRPWQHVLDPLYGYLLLASRMLNDKTSYSEAWNFGPSGSESHSVSELVDKIILAWGGQGIPLYRQSSDKIEANILRLDISKSRKRLGWEPRLSFDESVRMTADWYRAQQEGMDLRHFTLRQIDFYENIVR